MTVWVVLLAFAMAPAAPLVRRLAGRHSGAVLAAFALGPFVALASLIPSVAAGEEHSAALPWVPLLDVELAFRADGLGLLMALIVTGIGGAVFAYSGAYMAHEPRPALFFTLLALFLSSMLGISLADDVVVLYLCWELTSIASFGLIGFEHERRGARGAATQSLLVTSLGGLALLAGLVLMAQAGGSWRISELLAAGDAIRADDRYLPALLLILIGAFTKSAQLPFHFWLPNAMLAPTPVSAYLHSATMVNAGVFLLARLSPAIGGTTAWQLVLAVTGGLTMLYGGIVALQQRDLKRLLAYSTISALGVLTLLAGLGGSVAAHAFAAWLLAHALYKAALFMAAGVFDRASGTRDVTRMQGLWRAVPLSAVAAVVAGVSMAGVPPLLGFAAKEELYAAVIVAPGSAAVALSIVAAVLTAAATVLAAGIVAIDPLRRGGGDDRGGRSRGETVGLWLPALALAAAGVLLGVGAGPLGEWIISPAADAMVGGAEPERLHALPRPGVAMLLSLTGLAIGVAGYPARRTLRGQIERVAARVPWDGDLAYARALTALQRIAVAQTLVLQSGRLRRYLLAIVIAATPLIAAPLVLGWAVRLPDREVGLPLHELGLAAIIVVAAIFAAVTRARLGAVTALGIVSYGIAVIWVFFGAPDLALTHLLVQTLTVLLFVFVFYHLPRLEPRPSSWLRVRDALVAGGLGATMTALMLASLDTSANRPMSEFFLGGSEPQARGRNVVNTILVDFRALDTLGEITVLAVSAIGVVALLGFRRGDS